MIYSLLPTFQVMHEGFYCLRKSDDGAADTHLHVISQFYLPKFLWICILSSFHWEIQHTAARMPLHNTQVFS